MIYAHIHDLWWWKVNTFRLCQRFVAPEVFFFGLYLDPWRKSSNLMSIVLRVGVEMCQPGQRLCTWYVGTSKQRLTRQKLETETLKKLGKKENSGNIEVSVTRRLCYRFFPSYTLNIQPIFNPNFWWGFFETMDQFCEIFKLSHSFCHSKLDSLSTGKSGRRHESFGNAKSTRSQDGGS